MSCQYQSQNGITFIYASITVANKQEDMQCMYNVTLRCVHATIAAVENQ
jgi:hypothetical protein